MPRFINNADFVHLHNHSEYSSFDGLNRIQAHPEKDKSKKPWLSLPERAKEMGFKSIALTDHGNIGGSIKFMNACRSSDNKKFDIKPICGCEFYLAKDRTINYTQRKEGSKTILGQTDGRRGNRHLVLIAKNWKGWQNLCTLSQKAWTEGYYIDPRIDLPTLAAHSEGLICNSACLSSIVNANLLHDRFDMARKAVGIFKDIFKEDFHLEVMYHGIDAEALIIPDVIKLGKEMNVPIIATNDCHYCQKEQGLSQELLMCMMTSRCLHDPKHLHFPYHEFYLKSAEEMGKIFGSNPEFLFNTVMVSDKIDANNIYENMTSGMRLPPYKVPPPFKTPMEYMEHLAWEGMKKLGWESSQPHIDRLKQEIEDVRVAWDNNKYDFATYFLIVRDYMQEAKKRNILTGCGRGSGYASVLLRVIGIAYGPDPLKYDLIWERFLGFDDKFFVQEQDFFGEIETKKADEVVAELFEDRDVTEDPGGVDRY
jgi:DNA polymerase-3 subunit alpha